MNSRRERPRTPNRSSLERLEGEERGRRTKLRDDKTQRLTAALMGIEGVWRQEGGDGGGMREGTTRSTSSSIVRESTRPSAGADKLLPHERNRSQANANGR